MLQIQNLSKEYSGQVLLNNASFKLSAGEKLGLVGRNGTGKTTLLKMIRGLELPDSGEIFVPKNYTIGALEQHIHFTHPTVLEECLSVLKSSNEEEGDQSYKAKKILMGLGLTVADFEKSPLSFSGGYQIRINLTKLLLQQPSLLLLDEPTNYLDIVSLDWLKRFLKNYPGEVIIVTHDRKFMDDVVDSVMGIIRKEIKKFPGDTAYFYQRIFQEEVQYEKNKENLDKKRKQLEQFVTRFKAKASKASQAQSKMKQLEKMGEMADLQKDKNLAFEFNFASCPSKVLMNVSHLSFSYDKVEAHQLFRNLSFTVHSQDRIAIIGKNGKGKSTLINVLAKELESDSGTIHTHASLKMGLFGQTNIQRLNLDNSIIEEITSVNPSLPIQKIRNIAGTMLFEGELAKKQIKVLSGGERARVMLGKILATPTNLLLLDEPTNHLDIESIQSLSNEINEYPGAAIIVTHNEELLHAFAQKLIVFKAGGVEWFEGTYQDFLDKGGWKEEQEEVKKDQTEVHSMSAKVQIQQTFAQNKTKMNELKSDIEKVEKQIIEHEELLKKIQEKLILAYEQNNSTLIAEFVPLEGKLNKKIEELYAQFELVSEELSLLQEQNI